MKVKLQQKLGKSRPKDPFSRIDRGVAVAGSCLPILTILVEEM
jgi:hypothetical protein